MMTLKPAAEMVTLAEAEMGQFIERSETKNSE